MMEGTQLNSDLINAIQDGSHNDIKLLIDRGADVNYQNPMNKNRTALHEAVLLSDKRIINLLIENNADLNARNDIGSTPFHFAVWAGDIDIIQLLNAKGADTTLIDNVGRTSIHVAAEKNHYAIIDFLATHTKTDVNYQNNAGQTALHRAVIKGYAACIRSLVQHGADMTIKDSSQLTALDMAKKNGKTHVIDFLELQYSQRLTA